MFRVDHPSTGSPRMGVTECDREASKVEAKIQRPAKALQGKKKKKFPVHQLYVQKRISIRYLQHKAYGVGGKQA